MSPRFLLLLAAAPALLAASEPPGDDPLLGAQTVPDEVLATQRGGFAFQGMVIAFGADIRSAIEINIAPRTVERHIENVRLKLNARNRAHLITQAMHLGLLVIETPSPEEPTLFALK